MESRSFFEGDFVLAIVVSSLSVVGDVWLLDLAFLVLSSVLILAFASVLLLALASEFFLTAPLVEVLVATMDRDLMGNT